MAGYVGNVPVPQATQTRDNFTATAGQTTFATTGYTPGFLDVYLNGVHLDVSDFTATNGSDVVLATGAAAGDVLTVVAFTTFNPAAVGTTSILDGAITQAKIDSSVTFGAVGGGSDEVFYENDQTVTANYTVTTNKNAMTAGPVTINSGVTVTVPTGSRWVVV